MGRAGPALLTVAGAWIALVPAFAQDAPPPKPPRSLEANVICMTENNEYLGRFNEARSEGCLETLRELYPALWGEPQVEACQSGGEVEVSNDFGLLPIPSTRGLFGVGRLPVTEFATLSLGMHPRVEFVRRQRAETLNYCKLCATENEDLERTFQRGERAQCSNLSLNPRWSQAPRERLKACIASRHTFPAETAKAFPDLADHIVESLRLPPPAPGVKIIGPRPTPAQQAESERQLKIQLEASFSPDAMEEFKELSDDARWLVERSLFVRFLGEQREALNKDLDFCSSCASQRRTTEQQTQSAQQNACFDVLPRSAIWQPDPQADFNRCIDPRNSAKAEIDRGIAARQVELDQCNRCNSFEFATTQHVDEAQKLGCLPQLQSLQPDWWKPGRANFQACMLSPEQQSTSILKERTRQLDACRAQNASLPRTKGPSHMTAVSLAERGALSSTPPPAPQPQGGANPVSPGGATNRGQRIQDVVRNPGARSNSAVVAPYGGMYPTGPAPQIYVQPGIHHQQRVVIPQQQMQPRQQPNVMGSRSSTFNQPSSGGQNATGAGQAGFVRLRTSTIQPAGRTQTAPVVPDKRINYGACSECKPPPPPKFKLN